MSAVELRRSRSDLATPAPSELASEGTRRHLSVLDRSTGKRAKPRLVYAGITVAAVLAIVVAQLLLSIAVSQGAYQIGSLQDTKTSLAREHQAVSEDVNRLSSPQNLAANANALGMVSNGTPVYLRLSDGAVLGSPVAASGDAGTVTGASGKLVPNALLNGVPLVTQTKDVAGSLASTSGSAPKTPATPDPNAQNPANGPVALDGALPAPTTH
jgi:cell division protein FtsL